MDTINKSKSKSKTVIGLFCILGLGLLGYSVYLHTSIHSLRTDVNVLGDKLDTINSKLSKSTKPEESNQNTDSSSESNQPAPSLHDDNFTAILPHGGFLSSGPTVNFEWTPHKDADGYIIEIKHSVQQSYPAQPPQDQILSTVDFQNIPEKLSLQKNLSSGDYYWRVTATKNGNPIQSTEDRSYQVQ